MKYLKYEPSTGNITDANGTLVSTMPGFIPIEVEQSTGVDDIIKLKNAGFTAEEIIAIKKASLDK